MLPLLVLCAVLLGPLSPSSADDAGPELVEGAPLVEGLDTDFQDFDLVDESSSGPKLYEYNVVAIGGTKKRRKGRKRGGRWGGGGGKFRRRNKGGGKKKQRWHQQDSRFGFCTNKCEPWRRGRDCRPWETCKRRKGWCAFDCVLKASDDPITLKDLILALRKAELPKQRKRPLKRTRRRSARQQSAIRRADSVTKLVSAQAERLLKVSCDILGVKDTVWAAEDEDEWEEKDVDRRFHGGGMDSRSAERIINQRLPEDQCGKEVLKCNWQKKWRTFDGTCNNLQHPEWGSAHSLFRRYIHADYDDGCNSPKHLSRVPGKKLPSAREVSLRVVDTDEVKAEHISHLVMQWGQFLDHDLTLTAEGTEEHEDEENPIDCADCESKEASDCCFPIPLPFGDPKREEFPTGCMHFKRSAAGQQGLGKREQKNQITAFIDASNVYGSDMDKAAELRTKSGGKLVTSGPDGEMMMQSPADCPEEAKEQCFTTGDVRSNEQNGLVSIHTLWVHHHNKIAHQLAHLNPHWGDGKLFQTTRKIVGALMQRITYDEWLPKKLNGTVEILGRSLMREWVLEWEAGQRYNAHCDPSIHNSFATAAFRFGHSLIAKHFDLNDGSQLDLLSKFFNSTSIFQGKMSFMMSLMKGAMTQKANGMDTCVNVNVKEHLFRTEEGGEGLDLVALNIQRGRDHGLPAYPAFRNHFHLDPVRRWWHLRDVMPRKIVRKLRRLYKSVHDIDLFVAVLAEIPRHGALVGPTTAAIIGDGFRRLKFCDRFWYEWRAKDVGQRIAFTKQQRKQLKRVTMSSVLCDHVKEDSKLPLDAFSVPKGGGGGGGGRGRRGRRGKKAKRLWCKAGAKELTNFDLTPWKEAPPRRFNRRRRQRGGRRGGQRGKRSVLVNIFEKDKPITLPSLVPAAIEKQCFAKVDPFKVLLLDWE